MTLSSPRVRLRARASVAAAAGTAVLACLGLHAATASASTSQTGLIVDDTYSLQYQPAQDVAQFRQLGASTLRIMLPWYQIAPSASSTRAPRFNASNPGSYPAGNWSQWDTAIEDATAAGMKVDLDVMGAPPRWAEGSGIPSSYVKSHWGWKVNARDFGQFVQAVATRYDGRFKPAGASAPLPRVKIWSLWNEPNAGESLGPQNIDANAHSDGYSLSAGTYRNMLRAGYSALQRSQRGSTILFGELAGQGDAFHKTRKYPQGLPGNSDIAQPVSFIQALYCLDSHDRPLAGLAARVSDCPTNAGGRRSFVRSNPGLFDASAFAMHPYASLYAPNVKASKVPANDIILPVIGRLTNELSAVTRAWHHTRNYSVWSTEYGFITSPPEVNRKGQAYPSPQQAAIDINEAEYLSYRNPRMASYGQYLLADPPFVKGVGLFASGLESATGKPKATFAAYRLPLWLPRSSVRKGTNTEIWGGARPAVYASRFGAIGRRVQIQMLSRGHWNTIRTVTVSGSTGYFDTHVRMNAGGQMRLAYTYPADELGLPPGVAGTTVYSRTQNLTVKR